MKRQRLFQYARECNECHHRQDGRVHCRGVNVFDAHKSRENQGHNHSGEYVHRFEPAPKKTYDNAEKSHSIDVMALFRCMAKEVYQSNLLYVCFTLFCGVNRRPLNKAW